MMAALTQLVDLRLTSVQNYSISVSMMSRLQRLTRLQLAIHDSRKYNMVVVEPGVLSGETLLQHSELHNGRADDADDAAGELQLLSDLGTLQQLTYLALRGSLHHRTEPGALQAAAYSVLTASSKLQHLDISGCTVAADLWQHVLPARRQLLQLRSLDISDVKQFDSDPQGQRALYHAAAPEVTRLVSCCPGLQSLSLLHLQGSSTELLGPLRQLSGLQQVKLDESCQYYQRLPMGWAKKKPFGWRASR
jgi:hypothetical protein